MKNHSRLLLVFVFFLVVAATMSQVKAAPKPQSNKATVTLNLQASYNFIATQLQTGLTAKGICQKSPYIQQVQTLEKSPTDMIWKSFSCLTGGDNFKISPDYGYMVVASKSAQLALTGEKSRTFNHKLEIGWNAFGVPQAADVTMKAGYLCGNYGDSGLVITEVYRWKNGAWDSYLCPDYNPSWPATLNNFDLKATEGYLVKAKKL